VAQHKTNVQRTNMKCAEKIYENNMKRHNMKIYGCVTVWSQYYTKS